MDVHLCFSACVSMWKCVSKLKDNLGCFSYITHILFPWEGISLACLNSSKPNWLASGSRVSICFYLIHIGMANMWLLKNVCSEDHTQVLTFARVAVYCLSSQVFKFEFYRLFYYTAFNSTLINYSCKRQLTGVDIGLDVEGYTEL